MRIWILVLEDLGRERTKAFHYTASLVYRQRNIVWENCGFCRIFVQLGNKISFFRPDFQTKMKRSQMKTANAGQLGNKCLNSSNRNSRLCRIKVPQKPPFPPAGSGDLISAANEI